MNPAYWLLVTAIIGWLAFSRKAQRFRPGRVDEPQVHAQEFNREERVAMLNSMIENMYGQRADKQDLLAMDRQLSARPDRARGDGSIDA